MCAPLICRVPFSPILRACVCANMLRFRWKCEENIHVNEQKLLPIYWQYCTRNFNNTFSKFKKRSPKSFDFNRRTRHRLFFQLLFQSNYTMHKWNDVKSQRQVFMSTFFAPSNGINGAILKTNLIQSRQRLHSDWIAVQSNNKSESETERSNDGKLNKAVSLLCRM